MYLVLPFFHYDGGNSLLTFNVVAGEKLQHLINADDREGELQDHHPLLNVQMGQFKDHLDKWGESVGVNSTVEITTKRQNCNFCSFLSVK